MCQAVHAKPPMIALEAESGQNEPMQNRHELEHDNNRMLSLKPNAEHAAVEPWHLVALWSHG